jgi:hypothetical protein
VCSALAAFASGINQTGAEKHTNAREKENSLSQSARGDDDDYNKTHE